MGRELKRVPLDFNWPENEVWEGYINPHHEKQHTCEACEGTGYSPEAKRLADKWYGKVPFKPEERGSIPFTSTHFVIRALAERNVSAYPQYYGRDEEAVLREARRLAIIFNKSWSHHLNTQDIAALIEGGRLVDFTHIWTQETGWKPKEPAYIPTPEEVNVWSLSGLGHDSINSWVVIKAECKRLGVSDTCSLCNGEGHVWGSPEDKMAYEDWKPTEPPRGEGYQIWETVSEGSPISPVFATAELLAAHMSVTRKDEGSYETWLKFINGPGWSPTLYVQDDKGIRSGVEAVTERD